jgi:plastocyanin
MIKYISMLLIFLVMPVLAFSADEKDIYIAETGADGVQRIAMTADSYFFKPAHIVVKAGVPVELAIKNESTLIPHNFVMKSPEAGMEVSEKLSGDSTIVRFTPTMTGEYAFYCDKRLLFLKSHKARGMEGVIEVR